MIERKSGKTELRHVSSFASLEEKGERKRRRRGRRRRRRGRRRRRRRRKDGRGDRENK